jgi:hypothetical protein
VVTGWLREEKPAMIEIRIITMAALLHALLKLTMNVLGPRQVATLVVGMERK